MVGPPQHQQQNRQRMILIEFTILQTTLLRSGVQLKKMEWTSVVISDGHCWTTISGRWDMLSALVSPLLTTNLAWIPTPQPPTLMSPLLVSSCAEERHPVAFWNSSGETIGSCLPRRQICVSNQSYFKDGTKMPPNARK